MKATANVGVVGLAVMGSNLARNLARREGNTVAIFNRTPEKTRELAQAHPESGFVAAESIEEFAKSLRSPRTAIIMVQAGPATDAVIEQLIQVFEPGDIIVDGGNAFYGDTERREARVHETGIRFVGAGISGGEEGALNGPSIMVGGLDDAWTTLGPLLRGSERSPKASPVLHTSGRAARDTSSRWCTTASSMRTCS